MPWACASGPWNSYPRATSEKTWGTTKRATDALLLARTGEEPERSSESPSPTGLRMLESLGPEVRRARMVRRYHTRQGHLHGDCEGAGDPHIRFPHCVVSRLWSGQRHREPRPRSAGAGPPEARSTGR